MKSGLGPMIRFCAVAAALTVASWAPAWAQDTAALPRVEDSADPFPHEDHEGLFPLCTGCHEGAGSSAGSELYPQAGSCVGCHDGVELDRVAWEAPTPSTTHLEYDHNSHQKVVEQAGDEAQNCTSCHAPSPDERWAVVPVRADGCWTCHETTDHYADGDCTTCHTALSASTLVDSTVARWQPPADHESTTFLASEHGEAALSSADANAANRCATCHTQDQCVSCHVDATLDAVQALGPAPAALASLQIDARYPVPSDHEAATWLEAHGADFKTSDCSTCHTRDDCTSCHVGRATTVTRPLVPRSETKAPGVGLTRMAPATHAAPTFTNAHGEIAAVSEARCTTCHVQAECLQCHIGDGLSSSAASPLRLAGLTRVEGSARHQAPSTASVAPRASPSMLHQEFDAPPAVTGGFHPSNFVVSHSTDSWNGLMECANCHETQLFCRSCHMESGVTAAGSGRLGQGYHDAQPLWLLRHGQSARQALESCASCHRQNECLQCHSTTGAFRVSPHASDFDPSAVQAKAGRTCYACHLGGPPGGPEQ